MEKEIIPTKAEAELMEQEVVNNQAKWYLADTDWYVSREAETGVAMPADVKAKRAEARKAIV